MYRSVMTIPLRSMMGRMSEATWCARSAANTSASARWVTPSPSRTTDRSFVPASVPPGSRVVTTSRAPRSRSASASRWICVLLPVPSPPSIAMKKPRSTSAPPEAAAPCASAAPPSAARPKPSPWPPGSPSSVGTGAVASRSCSAGPFSAGPSSAMSPTAASCTAGASCPAAWFPHDCSAGPCSSPDGRSRSSSVCAAWPAPAGTRNAWTTSMPRPRIPVGPNVKRAMTPPATATRPMRTYARSAGWTVHDACVLSGTSAATPRAATTTAPPMPASAPIRREKE